MDREVWRHDFGLLGLLDMLIPPGVTTVHDLIVREALACNTTPRDLPIDVYLNIPLVEIMSSAHIDFEYEAPDDSVYAVVTWTPRALPLREDIYVRHNGQYCPFCLSTGVYHGYPDGHSRCDSCSGQWMQRHKIIGYYPIEGGTK